MKQNHCEPDAYTYTILIRMSGKAGNTTKFLSLLEEMVSKGCILNLIAYNTVIEALGKNKMVDKVIFMLSKMIESGCQPNEFTYSVVILDVLATGGHLHRLNEILDICSGHLNRSIYSFLIKSLCKSGHASEAHIVFCLMWSSYEKGDRGAFVSMLEALCNAEKTTEAIDLLHMMPEKGIATDVEMYNMVFSALGKLKQVSFISNLYDMMKANGVVPDVAHRC